MSKFNRHFSLLIVAGLLFLAACGAAPAAQPAVSTDEIGSGPKPLAAEELTGPAGRGATGPTTDALATCLSAEEAKLARLINEYRATLNLPPIPVTKSLTLTAQQHSWDLTTNGRDYPPPPPDASCNLHSWTAKVNPALREGTWTAVCFTGAPTWSGNEESHKKPAELANYPGIGVENSFASSGAASAEGALGAWKNSPGHNALIAEQGWTRASAMGVGINGGFANLWFGWAVDPAGEAQPCAAEVPPTAVPPTEVPPTAVPPTEVPPTEVPPTDVPPTEVPPTDVPPTGVPPTEAPPTDVPATEVPPTAVPATEVPATAVPATEVPATEVPATAVPPTEEPAPPAGETITRSGTVSSGGSVDEVFPVVGGRTYDVVITPSAGFDVAPFFYCEWTSGGWRRGSFDIGFEGEAESITLDADSDGTCTITLSGYETSEGTYTMIVTPN